jgi:predicted MFS family arabinose efflux permease
VIYLVYSLTAYPFGILADYISRPFQLTLGAAVLVCADTVLASATTVWLVTLGAALWGLQWGMTQGLLSAAVADSTPDHLRGTAFGVYDVANGITAFLASAGAGLLWAVGGPAMTFAAGACIAGATALVLMFSMLAHKYG